MGIFLKVQSHNYRTEKFPDLTDSDLITLLFNFFSEIRNGLIGVGLINVEDRCGVLSLDKGNAFKDI